MARMDACHIESAGEVARYRPELVTGGYSCRNFLEWDVSEGLILN